MKNFIIYTASGKIIRSGICQDETFDMQALEGEFILEGLSSANQYVENGIITDMPAKPNSNYEFDYITKTWVLNYSNIIAQILFTRDQLLKEGPDRVNPIWWSSMTQEQQQAWTQYRQDLLNITLQPGYPTDITWPIKPQ